MSKWHFLAKCKTIIFLLPSLHQAAPPLSVYPCMRGAPSLGPFLWFSSGRTPTAPCLSCIEDSPSGRSAPGEVSKHRAEGQDHLPRPVGHAALDAAQGMTGCLGYHPPEPPVLLSRTALQEFFAQSVHFWDCPDPRATPCTWPYWASLGSPESTSQCYLGPFGWHPFLLSHQPHHSAWFHPHTFICVHGCVHTPTAQSNLSPVLHSLHAGLAEQLWEPLGFKSHTKQTISHHIFGNITRFQGVLILYSLMQIRIRISLFLCLFSSQSEWFFSLCSCDGWIREKINTEKKMRLLLFPILCLIYINNWIHLRLLLLRKQ